MVAKAMVRMKEVVMRLIVILNLFDLSVQFVVRY
jgi:hypothetical protein